MSHKDDTTPNQLPVLSETTVIKARLGPLIATISCALGAAVWLTMAYMDLQAVKRDVQDIKGMLASHGFQIDSPAIGKAK